LVLIWSVEIFSVIAYASRAFAAYYAIQCGIAAVHTLGRGGGKPSVALGIWFALLGVIMIATALFGIPAETAGHRRSGT